MWGAQIHIFTAFVAAATASFNVEMMLHSYSNPTHGYCGGQHCEGLLGQFFLGDCDNAFTFCLRRSTAGNSSCVSSTSTSVVRNNDDFTFTSDILNTLGITNPLVFSNLLVTGPLELLITIYDDDGIFGRHVVDQILIPFNSSLSLSSIFSSPSTHTGTCQKASLTLSYRITSNCPANMYGPSCSEVCVPQMDRSYCNYLGERQCSVNLAPPECETCLPDYYPPNICDILCQNDPHGHFTCDPATGQRQCIGNLAPPECETCLPDYYPPNTCDTFCRPRDDSQGHFTCDPTTGEKICLPGFTNIASDCTECIGKFAPPRCDECLPDFYPPNTCDTFCLPRDDSKGHFTCDPTTGEKICLPGFTNAARGCRVKVRTVSTSAATQFDIVVGVGVGFALLVLVSTY